MKCISPKLIWPHRSIEWEDKNEGYAVSVPCGKCLACLSVKRQEWSFRIEQEWKYSDSAMFVTLTFDQKHYPSDGSLDKRDLQLYLKRLRKREGHKRVRYYAVGEYGSKFGRAHYHLLLFNALESNARLAWCDSKGSPIGIVDVGQVTEASISYVLKYMVQPLQEQEGLQKPFALMSRGYGIGGRYLTDEMVAWHRQGDYNYAMRYDQKVRLPRFYKSKIWHNEADRERVSKAAMMLSIQQSEKERKYFVDHYGSRGDQVRMEFRDAVLARIKKKVAFTQTM